MNSNTEGTETNPLTDSAASDARWERIETGLQNLETLLARREDKIRELQAELATRYTRREVIAAVLGVLTVVLSLVAIVGQAL